MDAQETSLVLRAKDGDALAFESLIAGYQKRLYNLAYRMVGDREDAADLAQEALVRAFKAMGRFREQAQFSTWLYRIVVNVCLDHQRSRRRHPTVSLDEPLEGNEGSIPRQIESDVGDPETAFELAETRRLVRAAIQRLPADHRTVVVLRDLQDLSYEDIADVLGVALGTVKSRLNRARLALREELLRSELLPAPAVYAGSREVSPKEGPA